MIEMDLAEDDLEYNPLYIALQGKYLTSFLIAQKRKYTICIPHRSTIDPEDIDEAFVEMHILQPSPYFKGQYTSTDKARSKTLMLENGELITGSGFNQERHIKIVGEEIGYNSESERFVILILSEPISTLWQVSRRTSNANKDSLDFLAPKVSIKEQKDFLLSIDRQSKCIDTLDKSILIFNQNYILLRKYIHEANEKLRSIWLDNYKNFQSSMQHPMLDIPRFQNNLSLAIESYLHNKVYGKLFPVLQEMCQPQEDHLHGKLKILSGIPASKLGASKAMNFSIPAATIELGKLNQLTTPTEKQACLRSTLDILTDTIQRKMSVLPAKKESDSSAITSDDLIPLMVTLFVDAAVPNLEANIYYIENFHWATSTKDELEFSFVTCKAALEYIKSTDFSFLNPEPTKAIQPVLDEVPNVEVDKSPSRFNKQLDCITQMLEESAVDLIGSNGLHASDGKSSKRKSSNLGSFLSSLQEDGASSSYGKLT